VLEKVLCLVGATLPVAVVGGLAVAKTLVDPPEEFMKPARTPGEHFKLKQARELCGIVADAMISSLVNVRRALESYVSGTLPKTDLLRALDIAEGDITKAFRELDTRVERAHPDVKEAVTAVFPPRIGGEFVELIKAYRRFVEMEENTLRVYDALLPFCEVWIKRAKDDYCECLKKAGVACT
jgi:hypothetical protein